MHCFVIKCLFSDFNSFHSVFFYFALLFLKNLLLMFSISFCFSQFDIITRISIPPHLFILFLTLSCRSVRQRDGGREGERGGEGLRSMLGLHTQRPAAGWIGVIDQAQSICSARLLGLCGWRLFLNYYRRQMLVRRCSLSRLDCFSAA